MAYSYNVYTGNGSTTQFTIGFSYIRREHVKVYVAFVDTAYTYVNDTTVQLATAPGAGVRVEVRRITPVASVLVDFADGSTLVAADLDTSNLQHLYLEQKLDDYSKQTISIDPATGLLTAANQRITNVADPVNAQDASTKAYTDAQIDSALINDVIAGTGLTISDNTPTAGQITVGITNSGVGATQIADGAVTSAKIADATIITGDLADGAVTSAKIADGTIVAGDLASDSVTTAKILNVNVTTAKIADLNVTTGKIADLGVTTGKIADAAVTAAKIAGGSIDSTKLDGATVVTNSEHSGSTPNDTSFFTTSASDARYFRQDSSETISSGNTWSASDSYIATTAAIDARVIDLVDEVGGFVPIANENSFPVANPDINNPDGTGTIVSIAVMSTSRTPSSGTVTIANGSGSNTVTITGCGSTVLAAGFGVLVETTSTLHTYTFHRLTPKATEVTTVASISADVTTVAGNNANVTAVAGNAANITTVAGSIANVNAVGGSIANVNSVASNLASVNSFANAYWIAASDPTTSLDVGDLVLNTTSSELRVYNGSAWQGGVTATGNLVSRSGDTMTGALAYPLGAAATPSITFTGDVNTGIYSPGADQLSIATGGTERFRIDSAGQLEAVSLGTAAAPTFSFTTDPDTGIYSPGANRWAVSTGGTGRLFVDDGGNVGIGITAPQKRLHVVGDSNDGIAAGASALRVYAADGSAYFSCQYDGIDATKGNPALARLVFSVNSSEKVRINNDGRVGIGSIAPDGNLTIGGLTNTGGQSVDAINVNRTDGVRLFGVKWDVSSNEVRFSGNTKNYVFRNGSSEAETARITSAGLVGVGTSSPGTALDVNGAIRSNDIFTLYKNSTDAFYIGAGTIITGGASTDIALRSNQNGSVLFSTNGATERMRIDASGRVGIGTTSPGALLDARGAVRLGNQGGGDGTVTISATNGVYIGTNNGATATTVVPLQIGAYPAAPGYTSTPDQAIVLSGWSGGGTYHNAIVNRRGRDLSFHTAITGNTFSDTNERARIDSSGRLLVGTSTAPTDATLVVKSVYGANQPANIYFTSYDTAPSAAGSLGIIKFSDSSQTTAAQIQGTRDGGTWTSGSSQPTRLVFSTTADGASSPTERFRISSTGAQSSVIPGGSTLYPSFDCRAWVNFNGTGTVAIRGSGNVSSITDNGTGDYTVNFTTALADANYAASHGLGRLSTGHTGLLINNVTFATGSLRIQTTNASASGLDLENINVAIFR